MIVGQVWLARRFRRTINVGMLASAAVLLVITVGGLIAVQQLSSSLSSISNGSFAAVNTAADARIDANNAKSNESLTLIARGSGQAFEDAWKSSADSVAGSVQRLTDRPELVNQWQAYTDVHSEIRDLDDGGRWEKAVVPGHRLGRQVVQHRFRHVRQQSGRLPRRGQPGRVRARWRTNSRSWSLPPSSPSSAGWRLRSSAVGALALG